MKIKAWIKSHQLAIGTYVKTYFSQLSLRYAPNDPHFWSSDNFGPLADNFSSSISRKNWVVN